MADGMLSDLLSHEMVRHPVSVMLLTVALGSGAGIVLQPFVLSSDFQAHIADASDQFAEINRNLCKMARSQDRTAAEQNIRSIDKELYELDGLVASGAATSRDRARGVDLRSEKAEIERNLDALRRQPPCEAV